MLPNNKHFEFFLFIKKNTHNFIQSAFIFGFNSIAHFHTGCRYHNKNKNIQQTYNLIRLGISTAVQQNFSYTVILFASCFIAG
jgi:hypothetical protein